jgi:predicted ester cyclase
MSAEENKATLVRLVDGFNTGNLAIVEEVFSSTATLHSPHHPQWPQGPEGARQLLEGTLRNIPDLRATREDLFAHGDQVAVRWTFRGTYQGEPQPGRPAPGEQITTVSIALYRFVDGKIEDDWFVDAPWQAGEVWA